MTEQEHRTCLICRKTLQQEGERQTCHTCVGQTRADLHAIVNAYALLPAVLEDTVLGSNAPRGDTGRSNERANPGGNVLALLAGGSNARSNRGDDHRGDPPSVAHILADWEDDWRRFFHHPAAPGLEYVSTASAYLEQHLGKAAQRHPAFAEFVHDLRRLRRYLDRATGALDEAVRADAPCFDCGGRLERHYQPASRKILGGLEDDWTCARCRRKYTHAAYYLAVRAHLERQAEQQAPETA